MEWESDADRRNQEQMHRILVREERLNIALTVAESLISKQQMGAEEATIEGIKAANILMNHLDKETPV